MKKSLTLILAIVVLVLLLVALKFMPTGQNKPANTNAPGQLASATKTPDANQIELLKLTTKDITSMDVTDGTNTLTFLPPAEEKGNWMIKGYENLNLNHSTVDYRASELLTIQSTRKIEGNDLSEYGLDHPSKTVTYHLKDGTDKILKLGTSTVDAANVYAMMDGDHDVYLLKSMVSTCATTTTTDLRSKELSDFSATSTIKKLQISGSKFDNMTIQEDKEQNGVVLSYILSTDKDPNLLGSPKGVNDLVATLPSFNVENFVADNVTDLSTYGLDKPVLHLVIEYYDPNSGKTDSQTNTTTYATKELDYIWGKTLDNGQIAFMKTGDTSVYSMDGSFMDKLITKATPFELCGKFIAIPNINDVKTIDITYADTKSTYHMDVDAKNKAYSLNDKKMEENNFKKLYQEVISISADTELDQPSNDKTPLIIITYTLNNGKKQEAIFTTSTVNQYYQTTLNGSMIVGCSKNQLDTLKATLDAAK